MTRKTIAIGLLALLGLTFIATKGNAKEFDNSMPGGGGNNNSSGSGSSSGSGTGAGSGTSSGASPIVINNYDSVWDYMLKDGRWYTKRKTSATWLDMQASLSPENYELAVSRLQSHLDKGLRGLGCSGKKCNCMNGVII